MAGQAGRHRIIDLELTNACPADCPMCPREALPKLGVMKEVIFERLVGDLARIPRLEWISLCGIGEPLLHPRVAEWAARLAALPSRPRVGLVTAGGRLTPATYAALEEAGLTQIEVSVQAIDPVLYARLMPGLDLDTLLANLEAIAALPRRRVPVSIGLTRHLANRDHIPAILEFARRLGFPVSVTDIHSRAGHVVDVTLLGRARPVSRNMACRIFEKIAFVAWDGRVHYCCHDVARVHVVGDLAGEDLSTINARKDALIEAGGPSAAICGRCDDPLRETL